MFFEKHKLLFRCIIIFLIALSLVSAVNLDMNKSSNEVLNLDPMGIVMCHSEGYEITPPDEEYGNWIYHSVTNDPQIYFFLTGQKLNRISVKLDRKNADVQSVQLYYTHDDEPNISEKNSIIGHFQPDGKTVNFYVPENNYQLIRLDINGTFSMDSVVFTHYSPVYKINLRAVILLLIAVISLILLESKIKLISSVRELVKREILAFTKLKTVKDIFYITFRWIAILSLATFIVTFFVLTATITISYQHILTLFWMGVVAAVLNVSYHFTCSKDKDAAIAFLIIALIVGAIIAYALPISTFNAWDEDVHYRNSLRLKWFLFNNNISLADTMQEWRLYSSDAYVKDIDSSLNEMIYDDTVIGNSERKFVNFYALLSYLPVTVVMAVSDVLSINYFSEVVLSKLVNTFVYAFIIFLGIRKLKSGKMLASAIALLPTCIFVSASYSYDHWVTAFTIYALAYFISEMQTPDKKITVADCFKMFGAMFIGCSSKSIYFVLMLPMVFMPKSKFESTKQARTYRLVAIAVMILIAILFMLPFVVDMDSYSDDRGGADVDAIGQVKFILTNPIKYAKILFKFIGEYVTFENFKGEVATYCLMGNSAPFFGIFTIALVLVCALLDRRKEDLYENSVLIRIAGIVGCFGSLVLIITALYVSYTPLQAETVHGVQCRYMFPLLFPFLYSIGLPFKKNVIDNSVGKLALYTLLAFNLFGSFYDAYLTRIIELI